jgi:hypothetical protein
VEFKQKTPTASARCLGAVTQHAKQRSRKLTSAPQGRAGFEHRSSPPIGYTQRRVAHPMCSGLPLHTPTLHGTPIPITGRGGLLGCEVLQSPRCVHSRLTDGDEVVADCNPLRRRVWRLLHPAEATRRFQRTWESSACTDSSRDHLPCRAARSRAQRGPSMVLADCGQTHTALSCAVKDSGALVCWCTVRVPQHTAIGTTQITINWEMQGLA